MNPDTPGDARFDRDLGAWVLSTWDDVHAALRDPRLAATNTTGPDTAHLAVRDSVARSFTAARLAGLRALMERSGLDRMASLPVCRRLDLVAGFARPWSLALAATVTGASPEAAVELSDAAGELFLAAAHRTDCATLDYTHTAAAELARRLPAAQDSIHVQAFVALSHTLPHTLAGAWLALLQDADAILCLRSNPDLMPKAVEELLRRGGISRAVFRRAREDMRIGAARIRAGDRVNLMLSAASHDPVRFPEPRRLDFLRPDPAHLTFGAGNHACAGARVVRMAVAVATDVLLRSTDAVETTGEAEWLDGFAIRAPASLPVVLRRPVARPAGGKSTV